MHLIALLDFAPPALPGAGNSLLAMWSALSQPAAALVLTAVWQGAAVALGLALCLRLAPRSPARHRFALWGAGFGVLVGLQLLPMISRLIPPHLHAVSGSAAPGIFTAAPPHAWLQLSATWSLVIASLWLAASALRAGDLAIHTLHLRKLWRSGVPVDMGAASLSHSLANQTSSAASEGQKLAVLKGHGFSRAENDAKSSGALAPEGTSFWDRCRGIFRRRPIHVCTTAELERPSVIGFFAPRILIPDWLFSRLTPGELDQIVLHETEHLRRRDDWTNLLQKLCLVLFPLNPGLAWIERRLCREREMACDDGVIRVTRAPRAYAACLASLAERGLQRRAGALSLGAWHARPELVRRVHSILRRKHALSPLAARAVLAAAACVLLAGATALARCPRLIAFVPAHSAAAPRHNQLEEASLLKRRSPAIELSAALQTHGIPANANTRRVPRSITGHGVSRADEGSNLNAALAAERKPSIESPLLPVATLKGHGVSENAKTRRAIAGHDSGRAENAVRISGASTPEDNIFGHASAGQLAAQNTAPRLAPGSVFTVMSAWETVEIVRPADADRAANKTAQHDNVRVSGAAGVSTLQPLSPRITVTRMYLKIFSSGDRESTWLVIQL